MCLVVVISLQQTLNIYIYIYIYINIVFMNFSDGHSKFGIYMY